jgi:hypothetical protein
VLVGCTPKAQLTFVILHKYSMKKLMFVAVIILLSCSKKEQKRVVKNLDVVYSARVTVLRDGTTLTVVDNKFYE